MNVKKFLPHITACAITLILLAITLFSTVGVTTAPFSLMEKNGIYSSDSGFSYGVSGASASVETSHDALISLMKKTAFENVVSGYVPFAFLSVALIIVMALAINSASKTSYKWTNYFAALLLPFIFCDFSNLAYFKTLYPYPLVLISLVLISAIFAGFCKNERAGYVTIVLFSAAVLFFSRLGAAQAVIALVLGIFIISLCKAAVSKPAALLSVILGIAVMAQSITFLLTLNTDDYKQNLYNSVFFGVCKYDSVTALGLDENLDDFADVYYKTKDNEADYKLEETFYSKISYKNIIGYYFTHPSNFFKLLNSEAKAAFFTESDMPFNVYGNIKKFYIPTGIFWVLLISAVYAIVCVCIGKKHKRFRHICGFAAALPIMWILSLVSAVIINGNCDIHESAYMFGVIFDIMVAFAAIGGIRVMLKNRDEKKALYGITHE